MKFRNHLTASHLIAFLLLSSFVYGHAAKADDTGSDSSTALPEVIVTAQKRQQPLSSVGVSATVFSAQQMQDAGVSSTLDLGKQTPGLSIGGYGNGAITVVSIRGSSQLDFDDQQEAPVAVYLDGAYISFLSGVGFNFYDIDHIEVLRGSQGTLFGRNASGGLINVSSKAPTDSFDGYVDITGGSYGERKIEGAVNLPISDVLKSRFSVYSEYNDGYVKNLLQPGYGYYDKNNYSARAQLLFTPNDALSVRLIGRGSVDNSNSEAFWTQPAAQNAQGLAIVGTPAEHFAYCSPGGGYGHSTATPVYGATDCFGYFRPNNPFVTEQNYPTFEKRYTEGVTAMVNYKVSDKATLTSISDWQELRKEYQGDSDASPATLFDFPQALTGTQGSQEVRLAFVTDKLRWTSGLYYLDINLGGLAGVDGYGILRAGFLNDYDQRTHSYAAFDQVEYKFTPTITGIIGGRWTEDEKSFILTPECTKLPNFEDLSTTTCPLLFGNLVQGTGLPKTSLHEAAWSGNAELDWRPAEDELVYGKVTRGEKAGGFNGGIIALFTASEATYGPELPVTYEVGFKNDWFDHRFRSDISAFLENYYHFQTFYGRPGPVNTVFNVDALVRGMETELTASPWKGWVFRTGVSWLNGYQKNLEYNGITVDRVMPFAPRFSGNASARREWSALRGVMGLQFDMSYKGQQSSSAIENPGEIISAYALIDGALDWTSSDDRFTVRLVGTNLANRLYFPDKFGGNSGVIQEIVGEPRWFYLTLGYKW